MSKESTTGKAAVLLKAESSPSSLDVIQITVPSLSSSALIGFDASILAGLYASYFSENATLSAVPLPISSYLEEKNKIVAIHASNTDGKKNRMANEVCSIPAGHPHEIRGDVIILYAQQDRQFLLTPDWEILHDVCYGAQLAGLGKDLQKEGMEELAKTFSTRLQSVVNGEERTLEEEDEGDDAWTDEDIEKPREPKKDSDVEEESDEDVEGKTDSEDEDSNASFEDDESELDSDEEDDPQKKAILDTIKNLLTKEGKIDLER